MTLFADLPPATRSLWAKSGEPEGHGLLAHMLDVAAVAETILEWESPHVRRWIARHLGVSEATAPRWAAFLAGMHDFGKGIPGFQHKWPRGQQLDEEAGLPFSPLALKADRHDLASTALLRRLLQPEFPHPGWLLAITQALGAHHGVVPQPQAIQNHTPRGEGPAWHEARQALWTAYRETLLPEGLPDPLDLDLPITAWLAGLTSIADWIGSNTDWFALGERASDTQGHVQDARQRAERALDAIGWPRFRPLLDTPLSTDAALGRILALPPDRVAARDLQRVADQLLREADGPTLMVVEAPMGEGKTELAFLAHLRLQNLCGHRGLYVALPTQATGNALFERMHTFLTGYADKARLDMQLVHGGAALNESVAHLRGIAADPKEAIASSAWFSQRKRPLISPYGAGTVDQALLATLNVKHHFVRLWGLANRVVVLDEVHAYDTYTCGLIEALLRWLKALNCSVILMSATLPARRRSALFEAWGAPEPQPALYPRIAMTRGDATLVETVAARPLPAIAVSGLDESLDALAEAAWRAVARGGCGAVIVNTVQRAQQLYRRLQDRSDPKLTLMLFHARYPADERSDREQAVLNRFGPPGKSTRPERALLIATQVVEQSLDLDFDVMLTDLAPIDLLLQRAGRLHRHVRSRPEHHAEPRLIVAGLIPDRLPDIDGAGWGFYDPYILYRTWAWTREEAVWRLPGDIDRLVQTVYGDEPLPDGLSDEVLSAIDIEAYGTSRALHQNQERLARFAAIDASAEPLQAYIGKTPGAEEDGDWGVPAVTRLGDEGIAIVPIFADASGWRLHPDEPPFDPGQTVDDPLAHRIYRRQVRLSRKEVVAALRDRPIPPAFEEHPLLTHLKPLILDRGVAPFGRTRVGLDPELGITYDTEGA